MKSYFTTAPLGIAVLLTVFTSGVRSFADDEELAGSLKRASTIIGKEVENERGEDLGKIEDVVIDTSTGQISYAVLSFTRKAGQAIGGAAAAYTIGIGGYVSGAAAQSDAALTSIRVAAGIVPAIGLGVAAAIMAAYPLTEDRFRELVREIAARRAAAAGAT